MVDVKIKPSSTKAGRNERRKAVATTLNAISVAMLVTMVFRPAAANQFNLLALPLSALGFVVLQGRLHYVLTRVED